MHLGSTCFKSSISFQVFLTEDRHHVKYHSWKLYTYKRRVERKWVLNCIKNFTLCRSRKTQSKCTQTLKANTHQQFLIRDEDPVAGKWVQEMLYYSGVKKLSLPNLAFMWKISVLHGETDEHLLPSSPLWTQVCNVTWSNDLSQPYIQGVTTSFVLKLYIFFSLFVIF